MLYGVFHALDVVCTVLYYAMLAYCVLSWFWPRSAAFGWLSRFLEPLMRPFRGAGRWIMEKTGIPLDFSPLLAFVALRIVRMLLWRLYYAL